MVRFMNRDSLEIYESYFTSAEKQGDVGEVLTASVLRSSCKMEVKRNIYLPVGSHYTEIDIIGISRLGVFVIENKNYSGTIIGDTGDKYWRVLYGCFSSSKLYNPVMQNMTHKKAVESYLSSNGYHDIPVFSPVIFNDKGTLMVKNAEKSVFSLSDFVEAYNSVSRVYLDDSTVKDLANLFHKCSNISPEMRLTHINLLKWGR